MTLLPLNRPFRLRGLRFSRTAFSVTHTPLLDLQDLDQRSLLGEFVFPGREATGTPDRLHMSSTDVKGSSAREATIRAASAVARPRTKHMPSRTACRPEDDRGERFWILRSGDGVDAETGSHKSGSCTGCLRDALRRAPGHDAFLLPEGRKLG